MSNTKPSWRGRSRRIVFDHSPETNAITHLAFFQITGFSLQETQDSFSCVVVLHLHWDLHGRLRWSTWHNSNWLPSYKALYLSLALYHVLSAWRHHCFSQGGAVCWWHHGKYWESRRKIVSENLYIFTIYYQVTVPQSGESDNPCNYKASHGLYNHQQMWRNQTKPLDREDRENKASTMSQVVMQREAFFFKEYWSSVGVTNHVMHVTVPSFTHIFFFNWRGWEFSVYSNRRQEPASYFPQPPRLKGGGGVFLASGRTKPKKIARIQ